jgi:chromosome segregation ATPase
MSGAESQQPPLQDIQERVALLEAELKESQELAAAFEEEAQATVVERDADRQSSAARIVELEAALKKSKMETNDALAELSEAAEGRRTAEEALVHSRTKQRQAERELDRLETLERQHGFDIKKLTAEAERATEEALMLQTTVEELRRRARELEGDLIHVREERDDALRKTQAQQQPSLRGTPTAPLSRSSSSVDGSGGSGGVAITQDMKEVLARLRQVALECRQKRVSGAPAKTGSRSRRSSVVES